MPSQVDDDKHEQDISAQVCGKGEQYLGTTQMRKMCGSITLVFAPAMHSERRPRISPLVDHVTTKHTHGQDFRNPERQSEVTADQQTDVGSLAGVSYAHQDNSVNERTIWRQSEYTWLMRCNPWYRTDCHNLKVSSCPLHQISRAEKGNDDACAQHHTQRFVFAR